MKCTALGLKQCACCQTLRWLLQGCVLLGGVAVAMAQPKQPAGGNISGHVAFADNDKPARFATVYLKPVTPANPGDDFFTVLMDSSIVNMQSKRLNGSAPSSEDEADLKSARAAATGSCTTWQMRCCPQR